MDILAAFPPRAGNIEAPGHCAFIAVEYESREFDLSAQVPLVMLEIDRRGRPIVGAGSVDHLKGVCQPNLWVFAY